MSAHDFDVDTGAAYGTHKSYILGFALSIITTVIAFYLVGTHALAKADLYIAIGCLAVVQLLVQLIFFLHLSLHSKARWNLVSFVFTALIVVILVVGTLWIMYNLYVNMGMMM